MPAVEFPVQDPSRAAAAKGAGGASSRSKEALPGDEEASFANLLKRAAGDPGAVLRDGTSARERKGAGEGELADGELSATADSKDRTGAQSAGGEPAGADGFEQLLLSATAAPVNAGAGDPTQAAFAQAAAAQMPSADAPELRAAADGLERTAMPAAGDMPDDPAAIGSIDGAETADGEAGPDGKATPLTARIVDRQTHFAPVGPSAAPAPELAAKDIAATSTKAAETAAAPQIRQAAGSRPAAQALGADPANDTATATAPEADAAADPLAPRRVAPTSDTSAPRTAGEGTRNAEIDPQDAAPKEADARKDRTATPDASAAKAEKSQDATAARLANASPRDAMASSPGMLPQVTMQRLAGTVLSVAADLAGTTAAAQAAAPTDANAASLKGPVSILELELTPVELGLVRVRMRMGTGGLEMQVSAAKAETAELLKGDLSRLADTIRDAGYDVDTVSIQSSGDGFRPQITSAPRVADAGSSAFAGAGSQGSNDGGTGQNAREGSGRGDNTATTTYRKDDDAQTASDGERARRGSLFV